MSSWEKIKLNIWFFINKSSLASHIARTSSFSCSLGKNKKIQRILINIQIHMPSLKLCTNALEEKSFCNRTGTNIERTRWYIDTNGNRRRLMCLYWAQPLKLQRLMKIFRYKFMLRVILFLVSLTLHEKRMVDFGAFVTYGIKKKYRTLFFF